ncbi:Crp/Fnr family transcriptional regulator [Synechococcus elongatus IITB7]|uniref:Crp/Fnr family transcriptional regulator n=1 Tax=Synechococcus elongatus TaxID=32046 RepID=UPI0030CA9E2F
MSPVTHQPVVGLSLPRSLLLPGIESEVGDRVDATLPVESSEWIDTLAQPINDRAYRVFGSGQDWISCAESAPKCHSAIAAVGMADSSTLQQHPLFADLSAEQLTRLTQTSRSRHYPAGQAVLLEHDWSDGYYLITAGVAKVAIASSGGAEVIVGLLGAGELFGELRALGFESRTADVTALTPLQVIHLQSTPLAQALQVEPQLGLRLAQGLARRLLETNRRFVYRSEDATARIVEALDCLAQKAALPQLTSAWQPVPAINVSILGSLAGMARETASRELSALEKRGLLDRMSDPWQLSVQTLIRYGLRAAVNP